MENINSKNNNVNFDISSYAGKVNFNTSISKDFPTNEAYKTLRTNILFCGSAIKTILITSSHENEGKSTISTELSKSMAEIGKRTLLIDADMRKSVILKRNLKSQNILGLSELLSGQATYNKVLYNTQDSNFDVIFSGRFPPNPVELLSSNIFKDLIKKCRDNYDYIIIDTPPLGPVIDAAVVSTVCDGSILVISSGKTQYYEVLSAKDQLEKSGCKILGAILNETSPRRKYNSKYYKKGYYYYGSRSKK